MAIWPFGRKGKRPRSLMKVSDAADRRLSFEDATVNSITSDHAAVKKPPRKRSKRDKRRSASLRRRSPRRAATEPASFAYHLGNHTSLSSIGQDNITVARSAPMLQKRASTTGKGTTLKKRLSKRTAREMQREQEIKALCSLPPSDFHHSPATWHYSPLDVRRGPSVHNRDDDHYTSNHSLPMGSQSSLSDSSDLYTYKVNAFAVLVPRPTIRYSENHVKYLSRSKNPSANSMRKDINQGETDDSNSRKRIAELADDLDAPALRELLERDRRRREKRRLHDQEKKQRRLQRRLEREQEKRKDGKSEGLEAVQNGGEIDIDELRGRDKTPSPATFAGRFHLDEEQESQQKKEESVFAPEEPGSWLREPSRDSQQHNKRFSDISVHVIGNIDDRSIRASKQGHHMNIQSDDEAPRHRSPPFQTVASTSSAHISSLAQESISDLSRTGNSEKRLSSDTSSRRKYSWIAFFRRPSLRKRRSKKASAPPSDFSNTSRDSFMKIQTHYGAGIAHTQSSFQRTGTVYRSQSKFVEHLGDYPTSPPDLFMQSSSPIPLEPVVDIPAANELTSDPTPRQSFTEGDDYNYEINDERSRQTSWDERSGVHPQSLASIDSEGSWMSGKYLRRISQQNPNYTSWRNSAGKNKLDKYDESEEHEAENTASDEYPSQLAEESPEDDLKRASSTALGSEIAEAENGDSRRSSDLLDNANSTRELNVDGVETWHEGLEQRPTIVSHEYGRARAVSKEVILGDYSILDTSSIMDEDNNTSPISQENDDVQIQRATSIKLTRDHKHARQISSGSVKLLDIPSRASGEVPRH